MAEVEDNVPGWEDDDEPEEEQEEEEEAPPKKRGRRKKGEVPDELEGWEDPVAELADTLSAGGADQVQVWRCPLRGSREFVDTFDAQSFNLQELRDKYGPGRYYNSVRRHQKWVKGGNVITLAAREEDMARWTPGGGTALVSSRPQQASGGDGMTETLLRLLLEQRQQPQQGGFQSVMKEMVEGAAAQTTALLTMFAELQKKSGSGNDLAGQLDTFRALMEFKGEMGGGSGGSASGPWDLLKPAIPVLMKALEAHPGGKVAQSEAGAGSEVAAQRQVGPAQEAAPVRPPSPLDALAQYMPHVIGWARENSNPEAWAAVVDAQSEGAADLIGKLYDAFGHDAFFVELERLYPDVTPHRTWAERFVASLIGSEEDGGEEDDEPGA